MPEEVLVLLSGGLDSTTCLAQAIADGHSVTCLTVDYGQKHAVELKAARKIAEFYRIEKHLIVPLPFFREIGGSSLTSNDAVPKNRVLENNTEPSTTSEIPTTYVPARNLIFLSIAVALAETRNIKKIYIGVNALDYSGYPDCRPEFIQSFAKTANLATRVGVETGKIFLETPCSICRKLKSRLGHTHLRLRWRSPTAVMILLMVKHVVSAMLAYSGERVF